MEPDFEAYFRAVNFLAGAQIYLRENVFLKEPLSSDHIKRRLLGHWGTCPGINFVHTHLNRIILRDQRRMMIVTGPGHGAPASLANLFLEGTLGEYYPELTLNGAGAERLISGFSTPGGFPSHLYPGIPGVIHEGGELGYALATAFGAAFDNPGLTVACIVGDGEAETGPTAAAWHSTKFLDPRESGVVLPVLHLNGYKISNPTIFGSMSDEELVDLFRGYGWDPLPVSAEDSFYGLGTALDLAFSKIDGIRAEFSGRSGKHTAARWPMLLLRSPKGWTGVKQCDGKPVEGTFRAHQVPVPDPATSPQHLALVEDWLKSYRPWELFDENGVPAPAILACCPSGKWRMGCAPEANAGGAPSPLNIPSWRKFGEDASIRGKDRGSPTRAVGEFLADVIHENPRTFRIFSPDELMSNKLGGVFEAPTHRNFQWPVEGNEHTEHVSRSGGRVLEILSEHTCQAWLQGYLLTGRHGLFPSYESFLPIVTSMMDQFAKFLKMSSEFAWRIPAPSLNYLETSTLWRQEHNGFSHQSPGFINSLLNKKGDIMRVYLPPDVNCLLSTMDHCLRGTGHVNLVIANKNPMPVWLSAEEAESHCRAGASIWRWASVDDGVDPDVVLVGIGDLMMQEVMAAARILRESAADLRVRIVNVTDLLILEKESDHPHGLDEVLFESLFTSDRPVIVNFHGYPSAVKQLLFGRGAGKRFVINGYREEGTTTTPFDMLVRNGASRYHLVMQALRAAAPLNARVAAIAGEQVLHLEYVLREFGREILETGEDPEAIRNWSWSASR